MVDLIMYNKENVVKLGKDALSRIDHHIANLRICMFKSHLNPASQSVSEALDVSKIFGANSKTYVPMLEEVWDKFNVYCAKNKRSIYTVKLMGNESSSFYSTRDGMKRCMNRDFLNIMQNLSDLSKIVVTRIYAGRLDRIEEDEQFLTEFYQSDLASMRAMSERVALQQLKKEVALTSDELKSLLSITITLFEKGVSTDYYQQQQQPLNPTA